MESELQIKCCIDENVLETIKYFCFNVLKVIK